MENYEKILDLLQKSSEMDLSADEENQLQSLLKSDREAVQIADTYNKLKVKMTAFHPDEEMLASYLMYENGEQIDDKSIPLLSEKIKLHLSECSSCKNIYESLRTDYNEVSEFVGKRFSVNDSSKKSKPDFIFSAFISKSSFRYAFASLLIAGFVYLGLLTFSTLQTPDYAKNFFTNEDEFYVTRGRTSLAFQKGLDAIENKNWDEAIKSLNEDIAGNSGESSIFYSHYVLGLTYLRSADSDFLGLFKTYDQAKVRLAVNNLEKTIALNISGNFENINLDANYYLGKAYLLLEDFEEAKTHLLYVVNKKGGLYKDAEVLLNSIPE